MKDMNKQLYHNIVYIPMCADVVHPGHLNIIKEGSKYGDVVIGLLSDSAIVAKKRVPLMEYAQRFEVVSSIKWVHDVIPQNTPDYRPNLLKLKPKYVIHGDDWSEESRQSVIKTISAWDGVLVEIPYTDGISSTMIQESIKSRGISPENRLSRLPKCIRAGKKMRVLEAHNGLSALVVENSSHKDGQGLNNEFDAIWVSSLTDSIAKGKPDTEVIDKSSRLSTINEILEVTTKPLIVDGDTGGHIRHFEDFVRTLERLGVSAIVIEDKTGFKRNSLHKKTSVHIQESPERFADKIKAGKSCTLNPDFMIIARIESLVVGDSVTNALSRAKIYIDAGADAIMIHSKQPQAEDIQQFLTGYQKLTARVPVMLVPTSYDTYTEQDLYRWGADIIVYANQLIRTAYPAMLSAASTILKNKRSADLKDSMASVTDMLHLVDGETDYES